MAIRKAERSKRSLRLCYSGPAGAGKTHSALLTASGLLSETGKVVVVDTENSVDLEQGKPDIPTFYVKDMAAPFSPQMFIAALSECLKEPNAEVVIIDTLTQEWEGSGGLLEMKEKMERDESRAKYRLRKQTVEPVFGTIKQWMGFRQFLLRGHAKVTGEWQLVTLAYNMKRLWRMQCAQSEAI